MSFGIGIGDILAIITLATEIRKEFLGAPADCKSITDEVRNVSNVLQDVTVILDDLSDDQRTTVHNLVDSCRGVLEDLATIIDKNTEVPVDTHGKGGQQTTGGKAINKSIGRIVKRTWKRIQWDSKEIGALRDRLSANILALNTLITSVSNQAIVAVKGGVDRLNQHQDDQTRAAILDWLTPINYGSQQTDIFSRRQEETGQWFLESSEFQGWLQGDEQMLFCPGIPGAGKTILTSVVVNELSTRFENDNNTGIAYVYCNFRRKHEQTAVDLIASLLKQLSRGQPSVPDCVVSLYQKHQRNSTRPLLGEMTQALHAVASMYSKTFVIVDALDECQTADSCRSTLIETIFDMQAKCGSSVFATSRFIPEITGKFDNKCTSLEIRASKADIARFLDGNISRLPASDDWNDELKDLVKTSISDVVDGMFLLAQLYLQALHDKTRPKAVKKALQEFRRQDPGSSETQKKTVLDLAYDDAMKRINEQGQGFRDLSIQVLSWITCAQWPLTTRELQHAVAVEPGESTLDRDNFETVDRMVSVCVGLVTVDPESDIIRLVHYTTQEYFERTQDIWFPDAHSQLATTCATYLSLDVFGCGCCTNHKLNWRYPLHARAFSMRRSNPLLFYAASSWGHHVDKAVVLHRSIVDFLQKPKAVMRASCCLKEAECFRIHLSNPFDADLQTHSGIHLATVLNVGKAVAALLQNGEDVDSQDWHDRTPLSYAAGEGHEAIVQLLLDTGRVMPDSRDDWGRTPLSHAAREGHEAIVQLLLDTGKVMPDSKDRFRRTPFLYAAEEGYEDIVQLLLDTGKVMPDSKAFDGRTPLSHAAGEGHEAIVQLLLDTGKVMPDSRDDWGRTPLSHAAGEGHKAIVQLLLDTREVMFDLRDIDDRTPLSYAAGGPLSYAAGGPLLYAAGGGHEAIVQLLLDISRVMPDSKDKYGRTPLSYAAGIGREGIVKLLLNTGEVMFDSKDSYGRTPLSYAAGGGHEAIVQLLLDTGEVMFDLRDDWGRTPLSHAAGGGHEAIVQLLLETGKVIPDSKDVHSCTALSYASQKGHWGIVKLLLNTGKVIPDSKDNCGCTPLSYASQKGHWGIVKLLSEAPIV